MTGLQVFFYAIAAFTLITAVLAVTARKIFRAAIWLLFSLVGVAAFYFWIDIPFLAAVQTVVYVGGIVVLIIFSIFLTQQTDNQLAKAPLIRKLFSALAALFGAALAGHLVYHYAWEPASTEFSMPMKELGHQLLDTGKQGYALPFEVVSVLLLAAMIGCIVIAMRSREDSASSNTIQQTGTINL